MTIASSPSRLRHMAGRALDLLLPPLCLSCDVPVAAHKTLCPDCWAGIHVITAPMCTHCGAPFEIPMGENALCGECIATPPAYAAARAAMLYDDHSRSIILGFKHADRTYPAPALAAWMHRAGMEYWQQADFIAPVPLHRWRLLKRRYNQAGLLAQQLGKLTYQPVLVDLLHRKRATPTQGHMSRKDRHDNVKGAFTITARYRKKIEGKAIVLVDDVLTTGATINECSKILLKAGAASVKALTLARVRALL